MQSGFIFFFKKRRSKTVEPPFGGPITVISNYFRLKKASMPGYCAASSQTPYHSHPRKRKCSLIPLLVLSPSNPLRWASMGADQGFENRRGTGRSKTVEPPFGGPIAVISNYFRLKKASMPGYCATSPSSSSMRSSWLYLATRSERLGAPVLI